MDDISGDACELVSDFNSSIGSWDLNCVRNKGTSFASCAFACEGSWLVVKLKCAIPFSQFLRSRRLCSDDIDFNTKCEEMCQFFKKRGYHDSAVTTGKHRAQEIDRETALQTSQNEETDRIPFNLSYLPQNLAIKNVTILRNDLETKHIFSLQPLISFKRDKNLGNFLLRSALKFNNQPGTFTCKRTRCKTCPFISNSLNLRTQSIC